MKIFFRFWHAYAAARFGIRGHIFPRGRWPHGTKAGPGRRPLPRQYRTGPKSRLYARSHPAGTKLARRFIRQSRNENTPMRQLYAHLTGHHYKASV